MRVQLNCLILAVFLFISACISQNSKKEKPALIINHVFTSGLPDPDVQTLPDFRHDYFYVYNYTVAEFPMIKNFIDTLFIDTAYDAHTYHFIEYDLEYGLPDTLELKNPSHTIAGMELGSGKHNKFFILSFRFVKGFLSKSDQIRPEKLIPDSYRIITYDGNERDQQYFLKDSVNGNLVEVDRSVVSIPDSGIR